MNFRFRNYIFSLFIIFYTLAPFTASGMEDTLRRDMCEQSYKKPKEVKAFAWLQELEGKRDIAQLHHQFDTYEALSREISATLAGKYGFAKRRATKEERQVMMASVIRTRDYFAGKPDIINDFYFGYNQKGCWEKVETDASFKRHMGVIAAADAIRWGIVTDRPIYDKEGNITQKAQEIFEDQFNVQKQQPILDKGFIETVKQIAADIHDDNDEVRIKNLIESISQKSWEKLIYNVGEISDIIAPQVYFLDILEHNFSVFERKGWEEHKAGQFSVWLRDSDDILEQNKKAFIETVYRNPKRFSNYIKTFLQPMTSRAVLLTPENKQYFPDMPSDILFDGTTIAVQYCLLPPLFRNKEGAVIFEPLPFYLTRKLTDISLQPLLSHYEPEEVSKRARDFQTTVLFLHSLYFPNNYARNLPEEAKRLLWLQAANLGSLIANNNYGIFLSETDPQQAEWYYKAVADRGLSTGVRSYSFLLRDKKANPKHIKQYLKMAELFGEFHAPQNNFASGLMFEPPSLEQFFTNVRFDKMPHCIKLKRMVKARNGDLEVHFRDANHLRCLIEQTPHLSADRIYYILDKEARDGEEFVAITGTIEESQFIHVMADGPIVPKGNIDIPYDLVFPKQSDLNKLYGTMKGKSTSLSSYEDGLELTDILENFDKTILQSRTAEARKLYEEKNLDRAMYPEAYPDLCAISPEFFAVSDGEIEILDKDYLKNDSEVVYMARTIAEINRIEKELKPFGDSGIFVINPTLDTVGVYSLNPLRLRRGFEILAQKSLLISGKLHLPNENCLFKTGNDLWVLSANIKVGGGINLISGRNLSLWGLSACTSKPAEMPMVIWQRFKVFARDYYGVILKD